MNRALCLVAASEAEFRAATSLFRDTAIAVEDGLKIARSGEFAVLKSGIGAVDFAEKFSAHLSSNVYDAVLVAGFAGALDPQLRKLDVVVYNRCRTARDFLDCDPALTAKVAAAVGGVRGTGLTVPKVVSEATEKRKLWELYDAVAVDMETHQVLDVCARQRVAATALRVISDEVSEDIPDFNRALGADGRIMGSRLPRVLIARPLATWRFLASMKPAMKTLKGALDAVLKLNPNLARN